MNSHLLAAAICFLSVLTGCSFGNSDKTVWVYTSLYKDTIAELEPQLKKDFPEMDVKFYQAGSEEVAGKVYAESLAGRIQADILITSDRFWYEDMGSQGKLLSYQPKGTEKIDPNFRNSNGYYTTLSHPVMVIAYNADEISEKDVPQTFKELADTKWKSKISSGSPLASGTSFTTIAFLLKSFGWDFFKALRTNDYIAEGGNSGVIRRIQNKERPVGIVLLENVLRLTSSDKRIKFVIPKDGPIIQFNNLAVVNKKRNNDHPQKIADWFFSEYGQKAMVKSFMYAAMPGYEPPVGAPPFAELIKTAPAWNADFIKETLDKREFIKEEFSRIVF